MNRMIKTESAVQVVNVMSAGRELDMNLVDFFPPPKLTAVMTCDFKGGIND